MLELLRGEQKRNNELPLSGGMVKPEFLVIDCLSQKQLICTLIRHDLRYRYNLYERCGRFMEYPVARKKIHAGVMSKLGSASFPGTQITKEFEISNELLNLLLGMAMNIYVKCYDGKYYQCKILHQFTTFKRLYPDAFIRFLSERPDDVCREIVVNMIDIRYGGYYVKVR